MCTGHFAHVKIYDIQKRTELIIIEHLGRSKSTLVSFEVF